MTSHPSVYDSARLAACYAFHRPPVHAPIVRAIQRHPRLRERIGRALAVEIAMDRDSYRAYIMGQTGVEAALARGIPEAEIRDWCQSTLAGVFGDRAHAVIFDACIAYAVHATKGR